MHGMDLNPVGCLECPHPHPAMCGLHELNDFNLNISEPVRVCRCQALNLQEFGYKALLWQKLTNIQPQSPRHFPSSILRRCHESISIYK